MQTYFLKSVILTLIFGLLLVYSYTSVFAVATPSFPVCSNPQGTVRVSYSTGKHGIVGDSNEYKGSDIVYTLSNDTLAQCFCAEDGSGIQTNWWKASSLSDSEIQVLKNLGWFSVPNGSLWGLDDGPYMAQNSTYTCRSSHGAGGGSGASNSGGGSGGSVLAAATSVLGLASTGNIFLVYSLAVAGFASILLGFALRKNRQL